MTPMILGRVLSHDLRNLRPRPNQRHFALKNVEQVRKFVEGGLPADTSKASDARVRLVGWGEDERMEILDLVVFFFAWPGVAHRPELEHPKPPAAQPDSLLNEEGVTAKFHSQHTRGKEHQWKPNRRRDES